MVKQVNSKKTGFTLLEMLISITLFSLVMVIVLTALITIIDLNRKTQTLAALTNNMNAATDSIVRLIKSGEKGFVSSTYVAPGSTCDPHTQLTFNFYDTEEVFATPPATHEVQFIYSCEDLAIYRKIGTSGDITRMTPDGIDITKAQFLATNDCQDKVNILIEGEAGVNKTKNDFVIQTTATRRGVVGTGSGIVGAGDCS